jgi:chromosome segregation ATPase
MPDSQNSRDYPNLINRIANLLQTIMEKEKLINKLYSEIQDLYDKIAKSDETIEKIKIKNHKDNEEILIEIKELKSRNEELEKEKNYYKEKALKYEKEKKIHQEKALKYEKEIKTHQAKENKLENELEVYKKKNQNYIIQNLNLIKSANDSYLESLKSLEETKNLYEINQNLTALINNYEQEKSLNEMRNQNNK